MTDKQDGHAGQPKAHRTFAALEPFDNPSQLTEVFALDQHDGHWRNRATVLNIAGTMLGGHIAALGIKANWLEASDAVPIAAHVLLLAGPNPQEPCDLTVETIRDGRRFAHRSADISDTNRLCARITGTFARPPLAQTTKPGGRTNLAPTVPDPETLPTRQDVIVSLPATAGPLRRNILQAHPFLDIREIPVAPGPDGLGMFWVRVPGAERLAPIDHYCLLALISDYWFPLPLHNLADSHIGAGDDLPITSLDHALWFSAQPDCADWILFRMQATSAGGGLGTLRGEAWNRAGQPIASFAQVALTMSAQHQPISG